MCQEIQWMNIGSMESMMKQEISWSKLIRLSKTLKGIQFKYSSFVNQTSALNISTTEEVLPLYSKNQSIEEGNYLKSVKSSKVKVQSNEVKQRIDKDLAWTTL